jgi:hypothetical protein
LITFHNLGINGRLGNQLFQYAALRGLSDKCGYDLCIPDPKDRTWHGQSCLLNEFNIKAKRESLSGTTINKLYQEPDYMKIDNNFFNLPDDISIDGYFQSLFYFNHCSSTLREEFKPKKKYMDSAKKYIDELTRKYNRPVVSLHLRRGDNVNGTNPSAELNSAYAVGGFYEKYIEKAIDQFGDVTFLVFTGGNRESNDNGQDIEWCENYFEGPKFEFSKGGSVVGDFAKIMSCSGHILSHVSSFGWWAAWVSWAWDSNKKVVAPYRYHSDRPNFTHRENFYPEEWVLV